MEDLQENKNTIQKMWQSSRKKVSKKSVLISMAVLVIVVTGVLILAKSNSNNVLSFLKFNSGASTEAIANTSVDYLNKNVLQKGQTATLVNSSEESGVIKFQIKLADKTYDSYATKDSKFLFPQAFIVDANANPNAGLSTDAVAKKSLDYINKSVLQKGQTATLVSSSYTSGVIKFQIKIVDKIFDSYATKDSKLFISQAFDMTATKTASVKKVNTFSLATFFSAIRYEIGQNPIVARLFPSLVKTGGILNPGDNALNSTDISKTGNKLFDAMTEKIMPSKGFQSKIKLGDAILKLEDAGVIDSQKFTALYKDRGGLPKDLQDVLTKPQDSPMLVTIGNANVYVNLLWALGLSNYMALNKESPVNGKDLYNFASTGGWNLGKANTGGGYFNKFTIVPLTSDQEALVVKIAKSSYRPCCDNSTFFQDCNHGSAALALIELGVSQGVSEKDLYKEVLAFNGFWFAQKYIETAVYYKSVKGIDWENVDPQVVLSKDFSSISGWNKNVDAQLQTRNLIPQNPAGGARCGA